MKPRRTLALVLSTATAGGVAYAATPAPDAGEGARAAARAPAPCVFAFSSRLGDGVQHERLQQIGDRLSVVAPNWYELDRSRGKLIGDPATGPVLTTAGRQGTAVWPVVNAQVGFERLFESTRDRRRAAREIAALAGRHRFDGITLDIEGIRAADRRIYTLFVRDVARRLHRQDRKLGVYVVRRTAKRPLRSAQGYDWRGLVRAADLVLASGYNEHAAVSEPGPITTTAGFRSVLSYARGISRRRVVPLAGAFGYRWPAGGGRGTLISTTDAEAQARARGVTVRLSGGAGAYTAGGDRVVFETAAGLRARHAATRAARMRWFGLFSLGREPAGTLDRLPDGGRCARWARS